MSLNILNKVINGDAINLLKQISNDSIDLLVTDPPYKTTTRGSYGGTGGMLKSQLSMDGKIFKHNDVKPIDYIPEFYRILKDGSHCYIMTNHINLIEMLNTSIDAGFKFTKSLVWNKGNKIVGRYYMSQFEYILLLRKGKEKKINNCGTADILNVPNKKSKDLNGKNIHDTEKPVQLMKILIENSSQPNEIVLDPFMGVGSSILASKILNRQYIGFEIDEVYHEVAKTRLRLLENN